MTGPLTILIIDDSKPVLDRLTQMLRSLHNVRMVFAGSSYSDGIQILQKEKIDAAVIDINMMGRNGIDLLKFIRTDLANHRMTVMMITEEATESKKRLSLSTGADYFIDKFEGFEKISDIISRAPQVHQ